MAELTDLHKCVEIDTSFVTEHVWQMDGYETGEVVSAAFKMIKLPRPMKVNYPRDTDSLLDNWREGDCFLVVDDGEDIIGYLDMTTRSWNMTGWISNIVVASMYRRRGVGSALLRAAGRWAKKHGLRRIMAEAQIKNYPAICFYRKNAYRFCGFNDQYYTNQDIALFFALNL